MEEISATIVFGPMDSVKQGFTVIELLIVVTIVVIFGGLTLANYGQFSEQKKLTEEISKLSSILHIARTKALAADTDPGLSSCQDFRGYAVQVVNATSYSLSRNCAGIYASVQSQTLPSNITITKPPSSSLVLFKSLSAGVDTPYTFTLKNITLGQCIDLSVNSNGIITESSKYTSGC